RSLPSRPWAQTRERRTEPVQLQYYRGVRVALERGVHMGKRVRLFALAFSAVLVAVGLLWCTGPASAATVVCSPTTTPCGPYTDARGDMPNRPGEFAEIRY